MDPMDFIKQAWSSFNVPTPFAPTLSLEDLDKRIADLHAVEQWLALNQAMLRNTIQGLEIQRAALAAVQNFASALGAGESAGDDDVAHSMAQAAAAAARQAELARHARERSAERSADRATPPEPERRATSGDPGKPEPDNAQPSNAKPGETGSQAPPINPVAWWSMMQTGFREMANAAMQGSENGLPAFAAGNAAPGDDSGDRDASVAGRTKGKSTGGRSTGGKSAKGRSTKAKPGKSDKAGKRAGGRS